MNPEHFVRTSASNESLKGSTSAYALPGMADTPEEEGIALRHWLGILSRRWLVLLVVAAAVSGFQLFHLLNRPPLYRADFELLVQPPEKDPASSLEGLGGALVNPISTSEEYYDTQVTILKSNKLLKPVLEAIYQKYPELNTQNFSYSQFLEALSITRSNKGQVLEIGFTASDPQMVKYVLDQLSQAYLDYTQNEKLLSAKQRLGFVDQQIPLQEAKVVNLQNELLNLQRKYNFYSPEKQGEFYNEALNSTLQKRLETKVQIEQLQKTIATLRQQLPVAENQAMALENLSQSPEYMKLVARLNEINLELAKQSTRLTDENIVIQQLKEERAKILPLINQQAASLTNQVKGQNPLGTAPNSLRTTTLAKLQEANLQLKTLEIQQQALAESEKTARQDLQNFNSVVGRYFNIQRELQLATESLNRLLAAAQDLEIESSKRFNPWRLVSEPVAPTVPLRNLPRDLALALLMGLIAGIGAALLVENLDRTYHDPERMAQEMRLSILGRIPFEATLAAVVQNQKGDISRGFLEAFAILFSNLFFLRQKQTCHSFVISSATSGDGKSTTAFFLAQAAAKLGQRVLLIDGDRYFPQGKNWQALANALKAKDLPDKIQDISALPESENDEFTWLMHNLAYFKTKDNAMEPEQLMASDSLLTRLQAWQSQFDIILIDAPPILGLSDAKLIARHTDGILLVARLDKTTKDDIRMALQELDFADLTVLGFVANGIKRYSGYYYYHYYNRYYSAPRLESQTTPLLSR
ncbi:AAA family ATPase [Synechocystis sp. LKSZ1]|uniref:GumC family protein n=1 Tax=Synechocystis sp. LKSZ1 TaxID=3144951 RepID=UPI00336BBD5C